MNLFLRLLMMIGASLVTSAAAESRESEVDEWPYYGHDAGGTRYSPLAQINRENVSQLKVAWVFHTGDVSDGRNGQNRSGFETTPLLADGTLYLTTPFNRVIALDPETGAQRWAYDPKIQKQWNYGDGFINRGVATWLDPAAAKTGNRPPRSRRRIFEATLDARLIALDADTGRPCSDFGKGGQVDLRKVPRYVAGKYHMTSPPAVVDDVVVVGSAIDDNAQAEMPSGVVRGFDARSGTLRWQWEPLVAPNAARAGRSVARTWRTGAGNAWSIMTVDAERHLVFVPTGSPSPDYYGGLRPGDNKWANSVVALRPATGEMVWGFQLVHHDLWDYDTTAAPLLANIEQRGRKVPVVIAGNKTGLLYILDRETGVPIFGVEERKVPQSDVPGEMTSPTQPFPLRPLALVPQTFSVDDIWTINAQEREVCLKQIKGLRNEGVFTPPSLGGTLVIPGNVGGMNWSGYAFDPGRSILFVNVNSLPARVRLIPREEFKHLGRTGERGEYAEQADTPYGMFRGFLQSPSGLPFSVPPWGTLAAVDLTEGKILWQVPLGSFQSFAGKSDVEMPPGSISLGGPIVTGGGLVFIGGTIDPFFRAFDAETGKELWKAALPAPGAATPMTYKTRSGGKQFVVIAAGGHAKVTEEPQSDAVIAFALP